MTQLQFKTPPFEFQLEDLEKTKDKEFWAYFYEQGLGKTAVALVLMAYLYNDKKIKQVLIISKNGVDQQIIDEALPVHLPLLPDQYFTDLWHTDSGSWRKLAKFRPTLGDKLVIVGINCEALGTKKGIAAIKAFAKAGPTLLIVDESQDFAGLESQRTVALLSVAESMFPYRRIMSGTPSGGNPLHYYPQMHILSHEIFPMDIWSFKQRYCKIEKEGVWIKGKVSPKNPLGKPVRKMFEFIKGHKDLDKLQHVISNYSTRVTKDEIPGLPPKLYDKSVFELSSEERRLYNSVKASTLAELAPGKYISSELAITKLIRLQQVACGFAVFEDLVTGERGKTLLAEPSRLKRLLDISETIQGKTLIWSRFTTSTDQIVAALSKQYGADSVVRYDGTVLDAEKQANKLAFKEKSHVQWFVGNPKAGGVGLDLPEATYGIYYSNDHSLISRLQSEDRCHRIISKYAVTYIDLVANKTVDDKILSALKARFDIATQLTGDQLRQWIL